MPSPRPLRITLFASQQVKLFKELNKLKISVSPSQRIFLSSLPTLGRKDFLPSILNTSKDEYWEQITPFLI